MMLYLKTSPLEPFVHRLLVDAKFILRKKIENFKGNEVVSDNCTSVLLIASS